MFRINLRRLFALGIALFPGIQAFGLEFSRNESTPDDAILLWPGGAPGAMGDEPVDKPNITVYLPPKDKANGAAVLICPGGGYGGLAVEHEGKQIAHWLNSNGLAGIILRYRLGPRYHHPAPMQDAHRAMRIVRSRATEWNVDPQRVGVIGFSAGGHLASAISTHFDAGDPEASDPIERQSCRPDFAILCYPVITMTEPWMHKGSKRNLLGDAPDPKLAENLSNDRQVTDHTPPTFLFHTSDDGGVPVQWPGAIPPCRAGRSCARRGCGYAACFRPRPVHRPHRNPT